MILFDMEHFSWIAKLVSNPNDKEMNVAMLLKQSAVVTVRFHCNHIVVFIMPRTLELTNHQSPNPDSAWFVICHSFVSLVYFDRTDTISLQFFGV